MARIGSNSSARFSLNPTPNEQSAGSTSTTTVSGGVELVLVVSGLVQLTIGSDTPVLRSGDAVLADRSTVSGWRNLLSEPALLLGPRD